MSRYPGRWISIAALCLLLLPSHALAGGAEAAHKQLIRGFYKAAVAGDNQAMLACFAPGYQIVDIGALKDRKGSKTAETDPDITSRIAYLHRSLPGFRIQVKTLVAEGDKVFAHVVLSGVQKGPFMGIAPTGKRLYMISFVLFEFKGGKIKKATEMWNQYGMMKQLGWVKIN